MVAMVMTRPRTSQLCPVCCDRPGADVAQIAPSTPPTVDIRNIDMDTFGQQLLRLYFGVGVFGDKLFEHLVSKDCSVCYVM